MTIILPHKHILSLAEQYELGRPKNMSVFHFNNFYDIDALFDKDLKNSSLILLNDSYLAKNFPEHAYTNWWRLNLRKSKFASLDYWKKVTYDFPYGLYHFLTDTWIPDPHFIDNIIKRL